MSMFTTFVRYSLMALLIFLIIELIVTTVWFTVYMWCLHPLSAFVCSVLFLLFVFGGSDGGDLPSHV